MNNTIIVFSLFMILKISFVQSQEDNLFLYDKIGTISEDNIFKTEGYYNWGASIIKEKDGKKDIIFLAG